MEKNRQKKISKALSFWLRHKPEDIGIEIGEDGWVDVMDLGDINGNYRKFMFEQMSDATDKFMLEKVKYQKRFIEASEKVNFTPEPIQSDELGFEFKNKAELLGSLLHIGNSSNKTKLLFRKRKS